MVHNFPPSRFGQRALRAQWRPTVAVLAAVTIAASTLAASTEPAQAATPGHTAGAGSYLTDLPAGATLPQGCGNLGSNPRQFVEPDAPTGALPTNSWWSSLLFKKTNCQHSETLVANPLSLRAESGGLGVSYPTTPAISGGTTGPAAFNYNFSRDFVLGTRGLNAPTTTVESWSDWSVRPRWNDSDRTLSATITRGSPFIYAETSGAPATLRFETNPNIWLDDGPRLGFRVNGHDYVAFAPTGGHWSLEGSVATADMSGGDYFSVAVLPTTSASPTAERRQLAEQFGDYAYAFVTDTAVDWEVDPVTSTVKATYSVSTEAREGSTTKTVLAAIPHQWRNWTGATPIGPEYVSGRGAMKVLLGTNEFTTNDTFHGVLPELPSVGLDPKLTDELRSLVTDSSGGDPFAGFPNDTYWTGKALGRATRLANIADQLGMVAERNHLVDAVRTRMTDWFTASSGKSQRVFYYDRNWGTLIGYPASYGSDTELNDHHFHYSYFVDAAATVARFDPQWATDYGPMVELLVRDANNPDRDDRDFPHLRGFDPYAGHSWASGTGSFFAGNNQESSSESINFAQALIQWGTVTDNQHLRDAGIYLYTTESAAISEYWHDHTGENFPAGFGRDSVGMVWGDGGAYATWFSAAPEMIHGINMLPITAGSVHLGQNPDYVTAQIAELHSMLNGQPTHWRDVIWQYQALADAPAAWASFRANPGYRPEEGESRAHVFHTLRALKRLGHVDTTVTADTPTYGVFRRNGGRTYVAANLGDTPKDVTFSDGTVVNVPARSSVATGATEWVSGTPDLATQPPSPAPQPTSEPAPTQTVAPTPTIETTHEPAPTPEPADGFSALAPIPAAAAHQRHGGHIAGTAVTHLKNGDWLRFDNVNFDPETTNQILARVASGTPHGSGLVEFRLDSPTNPPLGTFAIANTGGWDHYRLIPANTATATGTHTLYVTFTSGYPNAYVTLDTFAFWAAHLNPPDFTNPQPPTPQPEPEPTPERTPTPTPTHQPAPTPEPTGIPRLRFPQQPIEAETFDDSYKAQLHGTSVSLGRGGWLKFDNVYIGLTPALVLQSVHAATGASETVVSVRADSPDGPVIARFPANKSQTMTGFVKQQADIVDRTVFTGRRTLVLTVEAGRDSDAIRIDRFQLARPSQPLADARSAVKPLFIVHCASSHRRPEDPIVKPGQERAAHMHDFFGSTSTDAHSTEESMRASSTTCDTEGDTAGYWTPTLYDPSGTPVPVADVKIYYQFLDGDVRQAIAPPAGLRVIAGNAMASRDNPGRQVHSWRCVGGGEIPAVPGGNAHDFQVCPPGRNIQATILFPDCWNGTDLDSPDHKAHMAYSTGGNCPASHPVKIVQVLPEVEYHTSGGPGFYLASGDPITMHADFWNTWDQAKLEKLVRDCIAESKIGCDPVPYEPITLGTTPHATTLDDTVMNMPAAGKAPDGGHARSGHSGHSTHQHPDSPQEDSSSPDVPNSSPPATGLQLTKRHRQILRSHLRAWHRKAGPDWQYRKMVPRRSWHRFGPATVRALKKTRYAGWKAMVPVAGGVWIRWGDQCWRAPGHGNSAFKPAPCQTGIGWQRAKR